MYTCAKRFVVEDLENIVSKSTECKEAYIAIDGNSCELYLVQGDDTRLLWSKTVDLDGDTSRGGQSQGRHQRNREIQRANYLKLCAEGCRKMLESVLPLDIVLVCGWGSIKDEFMSYKVVLGQKVESILHSRGISTSKSGLGAVKEAKSTCRDVIVRAIHARERHIINMVMRVLSDEPDKVRFGLRDVEVACKEGLVEQLVTTRPDVANLLGNYVGCLHLVSQATPESKSLASFDGIIAVLYYPCPYFVDM